MRTDKNVLTLADKKAMRRTTVCQSNSHLMIRLHLFSRFIAGEGVKLSVASDLNIQLKMSVYILYTLCTLFYFRCFLFLPVPFSHRTYRN